MSFRRFSIAYLTCGIVSLLSPVAVFAQAEPEGEFWQEARELTRDYAYLINSIEAALSQVDADRVQILSGRIVLNVVLGERFLENYLPTPDFQCDPVIVEADFELPQPGSRIPLTRQQLRTYCAIAAAKDRLEALSPLLGLRLERLEPTRSPAEVLPGTSGDPAPDPVIPAAELPVIGRPAKQPIAGYTPPPLPAIAPSDAAFALIDSAEAILSQARMLLPESYRFLPPEEADRGEEQFAFNVNPGEQPLYEVFLRQPRTGIMRVLPAEVYQQINPQQNRLFPTLAERFLFTPILERQGITHYLALQLLNGRLQLVLPELDHGFMVELGDVPLESLPADLLSARSQRKSSLLPAEIREFFLSYRSPDRLEAIHEAKRRLLNLDFGYFGLTEPLALQLPVEVDRTYLLRSIQYRIPDFILTGEPITPQQRRYLDLLLKTPSSDLLIAFRPVQERFDGSYTVLWRILAEFPDPQIADLDDYVQYF